MIFDGRVKIPECLAEGAVLALVGGQRSLHLVVVQLLVQEEVEERPRDNLRRIPLYHKMGVGRSPQVILRFCIRIAL